MADHRAQIPLRRGQDDVGAESSVTMVLTEPKEAPEPLTDLTPEQTPSSRAQKSPFSPHPFWSEKAKAEAELAQARPAPSDEEARKIRPGNVARPASLEVRGAARIQIRVEEETREPSYTPSGSPMPKESGAEESVQRNPGAVISRESTVLALPDVGMEDSRGTMAWQGEIAGDGCTRAPSDVQSGLG